jgi:osmotically-inducible protein OsmY
MANTDVEVTHLGREPGVRDAITDVERRIAQSFHRCGDIDWRQIHVDVNGERATLSGLVSTSLQRWAAEYAALDSPGIAHVDNRLIVWPKEQQHSE